MNIQDEVKSQEAPTPHEAQVQAGKHKKPSWGFTVKSEFSWVFFSQNVLRMKVMDGASQSMKTPVSWS